MENGINIPLVNMTDILITNTSGIFGMVVIVVMLFWAFSFIVRVRVFKILSGFALIVLAIKIINSYISFWIFAVLLIVVGLFTFLSAISSR